MPEPADALVVGPAWLRCGGPLRRGHRRLAAAATALSLALVPVVAAGPAGADTGGGGAGGGAGGGGGGSVSVQIAQTQLALDGATQRIADAERVLADAQAKLPAANAALAAAQAAQRAAEAAATDAQQRLGLAERALIEAQRQLISTEDQLATSQQQAAAVARAVYDEGPVTPLDAVLAPDGPGSVVDRSLLSSVLTARAQHVSALTTSHSAVLDRQHALAQGEDSVASIEADARAAYVARQQALADAQAAQSQIQALVAAEQAAMAAARADAAEQQARLAQLEAASNTVATLLGSGAPTDAATSAVLARVGKGGLVWPADGSVVQRFGPNFDPVTGVHGFHPGVDIGAAMATPIWAAAAGTISLVLTPEGSGGYGNYTCIDHGNGFSTCYAHQSKVEVAVGQVVQQGQEIGRVGSTGYSTGPHLHFETRVDGKVVDPLQFF